MQLRSSFEPMAWPAVATGMAADLMALQRQLDATQWWAPETRRDHQFKQLRLLLTYAARQQANKPGLRSPFLLTRLVHFHAAIWHNLSPPLTSEIQDFRPLPAGGPKIGRAHV